MRDSIIANFGMNNTKFTRGMAENNSRLDRFGKSMGGIRAGIAGIVGGVAVGQIKSFADELDAIGKSADKIGVTTSEIQILRFAAEQTGGSAGKMDVALEKFNNTLGEARQGVGTGVKAFEELNISLTNADGTARDNIDVFRDFGDALAKIEDPATKAAYVNDLAGRSAGFLINTLRDGSGAIDKYAKQLEGMNGIVDEAAIRRAEELNDRLNLLSKTIKGTLTDAYMIGTKAYEKFFDAIGVDGSIGLDIDGIEEQEAAIAKSDARVAKLRQAKEDDAAKMAAAERERVQYGIDMLNVDIKARREAAKERIKLEGKLAAASERLNKDIARFAFEQMDLETKQIYLTQELNRLRREASSSTGAELIQVKVDALSLTKDLLKVEERLRDEVETQKKIRAEAQDELTNALAEQATERAKLAEQAEAEADEAERKAQAEVDSLEALQKQAIIRAADTEGGRETGQAKRVVELREEAKKQEDEGRFDKAARTSSRADKIEAKLTDRRRDRLFDKAREAHESGDTDTLQRLRSQAERQGFISPEDTNREEGTGAITAGGEYGASFERRAVELEGRDGSDRVVREEGKDAGPNEYQTTMIELGERQAERIEQISDSIDALRNSFDN